MKLFGSAAALGTLAVLLIASNPVAAAGPIVGQANFTFVNPPCTVGGDHVELVGRETAANVWEFRAALVNADPNLACAFATQITINGGYSTSAAGCVGTITNNICFSAALTVGVNTIPITMCSAAFWGGCRASVGPATIVLAS